MPFHHIEMWDTDHFERVSLGDGEQGLRIYCGHHGDPCPLAADAYHEVQIVDRNGSFAFKVHECQCSTAPEFWEQLFRLGLFPASYDRPRTAFSFSVLKDFQIFNFAGKVSLWDYWGTVQRKTDGVQWKRVKVRARRVTRATADR